MKTYKIPLYTGHKVQYEFDEQPHFQRVELYLVDADTLYKARPTSTFELKSEILHKCMTLAYYRHHFSKRVPMLREHWNRGTIAPRLHKMYYQMVSAADFDQLVYSELRNRSTEQRDEYHLVSFDAEIMQLINLLKGRPKYLSAPLYYDRQGTIKTAYTGQFYARFQRDYFRHETLILRMSGQELFFGIYHNHRTKYEQTPNFYEPMSFYNSEWVIPFLVKGNQDEFFASCDTTFRETYDIFKGLANYWYAFYF